MRRTAVKVVIPLAGAMLAAVLLSASWVFGLGIGAVVLWLTALRD